VGTGLAGAPGIVLANVSSKVVTAVAVSGLAPAGSGGSAGAKVQVLEFYDAATEPLMTALSPGQSLTVPQPLSRGGAVPLTAAAAIFADGSSWGDPALVARITQRRAYMGKYLNAVITDLGSAAQQNDQASDDALRAATTQQFQAAMAAELASAANPDESACIRSTRGVVILNLERAVQTRGGAPIAVSDLIAHELGALASRLRALVNAGL
jgi:hypothetical protein